MKVSTVPLIYISLWCLGASLPTQQKIWENTFPYSPGSGACGQTELCLADVELGGI